MLPPPTIVRDLTTGLRLVTDLSTRLGATFELESETRTFTVRKSYFQGTKVVLSSTTVVLGVRLSHLGM